MHCTAFQTTKAFQNKKEEIVIQLEDKNYTYSELLIIALKIANAI